MDEIKETKVSFSELMGDKNPYHYCLEAAGVVVVAFQDFGSYQGDWFAKLEDGSWIAGSYGSCSGCDSFEHECDYIDRTVEEWGVFCKAFGTTYLNDKVDYESILAKAKENTSWDVEASEMVKWIEANK